MTTSVVGNWAIAVAGFTGLIGMWLFLACGMRSERKTRLQRAQRERAAAQDQTAPRTNRQGPRRDRPDPRSDGSVAPVRNRCGKAVSRTDSIAGFDGRRRPFNARSDAPAGAQDLRDGPCLERASCRNVGRITVGGFGYRAEAPLAEVGLQRVEDARGAYAGRVRGVDVRADQPRPHGALVVGTVALGRVRHGDGPGNRDDAASTTAGRAMSAGHVGKDRRPYGRGGGRAADRRATRPRVAGSVAPRRRGRGPSTTSRSPSGAPKRRQNDPSAAAWRAATSSRR